MAKKQAAPETENDDEVNKWRIEGRDFDRVARLVDRNEEFKQEAHEKAKANHSELWALIHEVTGTEDDTTQHYTLDNDYRDLGMFILNKEDDDKEHPLKQLARLIARS